MDFSDPHTSSYSDFLSSQITIRSLTCLLFFEPHFPEVSFHQVSWSQLLFFSGCRESSHVWTCPVCISPAWASLPVSSGDLLSYIRSPWKCHFPGKPSLMVSFQMTHQPQASLFLSFDLLSTHQLSQWLHVIEWKFHNFSYFIFYVHPSESLGGFPGALSLLMWRTLVTSAFGIASES